jgi:hypothetical protein
MIPVMDVYFWVRARVFCDRKKTTGREIARGLGGEMKRKRQQKTTGEARPVV